MKKRGIDGGANKSPKFMTIFLLFVGARGTSILMTNPAQL
jgi:hypothetical protein